jgi:hypothetical protein
MSFQCGSAIADACADVTFDTMSTVCTEWTDVEYDDDDDGEVDRTETECTADELNYDVGIKKYMAGVTSILTSALILVLYIGTSDMAPNLIEAII